MSAITESTPLMFRTSIDIEADVRGRIVDRLNLRLADAIDLKARAKQAHWNVKGRDFFALHQLFDSLADHCEQHSDHIAERLTALGGVAKGTLPLVVQNSSLPDYDWMIHLGEQHIRALGMALALFGSQLRGDLEFAEGLGDRASADLLSEIARQVDKDLWMLEAHIQS